MSPRRRVSCESENEAVLGAYGVEMGEEGSEVKEISGKDVTENIKVGESVSPWAERSIEET